MRAGPQHRGGVFIHLPALRSFNEVVSSCGLTTGPRLFMQICVRVANIDLGSTVKPWNDRVFCLFTQVLQGSCGMIGVIINYLNLRINHAILSCVFLLNLFSNYGANFLIFFRVLLHLLDFQSVQNKPVYIHCIYW